MASRRTKLVKKAADSGKLSILLTPAKGKRSAKMTLKCFDCKSKLDIYYTELGSKDNDLFEIGGVIATRSEWCEAFVRIGLVHG